MNPALAHLRELAALDQKLKLVFERRHAREEAVHSAEAALEAAKSSLGDRHAEIKVLHKEADELNLEVRSAEDEVVRLSAQLHTAKSNKEYDVLKREVEAAEKKKGGFEDGVLERLERVDAVTDAEKVAKESVGRAHEVLDAARADLAEIERELSGEEQALKDKRGAVVSRLDRETRHLYEGLLSQRGDSALSAVKDGSCSACARKLTAQMEVLMDKGEEILQCMSCRRILYRDDGDAAL